MHSLLDDILDELDQYLNENGIETAKSSYSWKNKVHCYNGSLQYNKRMFYVAVETVKYPMLWCNIRETEIETLEDLLDSCWFYQKTKDSEESEEITVEEWIKNIRNL